MKVSDLDLDKVVNNFFREKTTIGIKNAKIEIDIYQDFATKNHIIEIIVKDYRKRLKICTLVSRCDVMESQRPISFLIFNKVIDFLHEKKQDILNVFNDDIAKIVVICNDAYREAYFIENTKEDV